VSATDAILFCAAIVVERGFLGENGVRNVGECTGGSFLPSPFVRHHHLHHHIGLKSYSWQSSD